MSRKNYTGSYFAFEDTFLTNMFDQGTQNSKMRYQSGCTNVYSDEMYYTVQILAPGYSKSDFDISVEFTSGSNSFWIPTPKSELLELDCYGIIDIGDDQPEFEKLVSLVHEIGHVIFQINNRLEGHRWDNLFEESLAWYLGYDYALRVGLEIDLKEYADRVEEALGLYSGRNSV